MEGRAALDGLLDRADAARMAGRGDAAARLYDDAIAVARTENDLPSRIRAVLGMAALHVFGSDPGKVPAQLYDVLARTVDDGDRARLSAALARCWAYSGHAGRAAGFAEEAVADAERAGDDALMAECLDAALAAHWGPDELDARTGLVARLDEVAAHVLDPNARLQATLWGLEVACQALNLPAMHRQMRVLEHIGGESPRAALFAASRRLMLDLLRGRTDTVAPLVAMAESAAARAGLADSWMVLESMRGYAALQMGDRTTSARVGEECARFGETEGSVVVAAEGAYLLAGAGRHDRSSAILTDISSALEDLPRDGNWLLALQCALFAALEVNHREVVETASRLLAQYHGRAVFNTGALAFHGVTDDSLARAAAMLGDGDRWAELRARALATYARIGAIWWRQRLVRALPDAAMPMRRVRFHADADGNWMIGPERAAASVRSLRGFGYLHRLLERPGTAVAALELVTESGPTIVQADLGPRADRRALADYHRRLTEIDALLGEAEAGSDLGRVDRLMDEREALLAEVGAATGLGGRLRTTGSTNERARVAVTKAISTAIQRISQVDGPTGRHLAAAIRTGSRCSYRPEGEAIAWVLRE